MVAEFRKILIKKVRNLFKQSYLRRYKTDSFYSTRDTEKCSRQSTSLLVIIYDHSSNTWIDSVGFDFQFVCYCNRNEDCTGSLSIYTDGTAALLVNLGSPMQAFEFKFDIADPNFFANIINLLEKHTTASSILFIQS